MKAANAIKLVTVLALAAAIFAAVPASKAQTIAAPASGAVVSGWTTIRIDAQGKTYPNIRCLHDTIYASRYSRYGMLAPNYFGEYLWDTTQIPDGPLLLMCQVDVGTASATKVVTMSVPVTIHNTGRTPGPAVQIVSPQKLPGGFAQLKGDTLVQAFSAQASTVQYFVNNPGVTGFGAAISNTLPPPFAFTWNSRTWPIQRNGDMIAVAADASGNTRASEPLRVVFR